MFTSGSLGKFSDGDLEAVQVLWDHCHDSLEKLGVEYVRRRASDKRSLLDAVLTDILDVLDKLDLNDLILSIYCEAADLLKLPSLSTGSSTITDGNSEAILLSLKSLSEELQTKLSRPVGLVELKQKLDTMQADMKSLESAVTSSLTSLSSDLLSLSKETSKLGTLSSSQPTASARPLLSSSHSRVYVSADRSMNIVLNF